MSPLPHFPTPHNILRTGKCDMCGCIGGVSNYSPNTSADYKLFDKKCKRCNANILLCEKCLRYRIEHDKKYPCVECRRELTLKKLGI